MHAVAEGLEEEDLSVALCAMRCLCRLDPRRARQFLARSSTRRRLLEAGKSADDVAALMSEVAEAEARTTKQYKTDPWRFACVDEYDAEEYEYRSELAEPLPLLLSVMEERLSPDDLGLSFLEVIEALGKAGHPAAVPVLSDLIQGELEPVQAAALRALGDIGDCSALPAVESAAPFVSERIHSSFKYAQDALQRARTYAEHAIETLTVSHRVDKRPEEAAEIIGRLAATGHEEAIDCIRPLTRSPVVQVRLAAVKALGRLRARRACRALLRLAEDADQPTELRVAAVRAVGKTRHHMEAAAVGQFLKDKDERLRAAALQAMGNLQGKRSVPALVKGALMEAFKLRSKEHRHLPSLALTKIGDRYAFGMLSKALQSSSEDKRRKAAEILSRVIGPWSVSALLKACRDESPRVRRAALRSLTEQATFRLV